MEQKAVVRVARAEEKEIVRNILEKHLYEMALFDGRKLGFLGLYGYPDLDSFFGEKNRYAFLIYIGDALAGFALVGDQPQVFPDAKYTLREFFLLPVYRRKGFGAQALAHLFDIFPGVWEIISHPKNTAANAFFEKEIRDYTESEATHLDMCGAVQYPDGTYGEGWCFSTFPVI
ncbi:MAG: GNAT family N-acetyltransferase [Oscillospiraceae bacterium]|nr:GNAT family N-acetyltransferase [Oscillospiraceae bacterium]